MRGPWSRKRKDSQNLCCMNPTAFSLSLHHLRVRLTNSPYSAVFACFGSVPSQEPLVEFAALLYCHLSCSTVLDESDFELHLLACPRRCKCVVYSLNPLSAAVTKGFFPSDRPGNPCWHCSLVLLFFFSSEDHEKRALFTLKPHGLPRHTPHTHTLCKHGRYPKPFPATSSSLPQSVHVFHDGLSPLSSPPPYSLLLLHTQTASYAPPIFLPPNFTPPYFVVSLNNCETIPPCIFSFIFTLVFLLCSLLRHATSGK